MIELVPQALEEVLHLNTQLLQLSRLAVVHLRIDFLQTVALGQLWARMGHAGLGLVMISAHSGIGAQLRACPVIEQPLSLGSSLCTVSSSSLPCQDWCSTSRWRRAMALRERLSRALPMSTMVLWRMPMSRSWVLCSVRSWRSFRSLSFSVLRSHSCQLGNLPACGAAWVHDRVSLVAWGAQRLGLLPHLPAPLLGPGCFCCLLSHTGQTSMATGATWA